MLFKQINQKEKKAEPLPKESVPTHTFFNIKSGVKVGTLDLSALSLDSLSQATGTLDQTLREDIFNQI